MMAKTVNGEAEIDLDERGEIRLAPVARRMNRHERFEAALDRLPPVVLLVMDDIIAGKKPTLDEMRVCEPYLRAIIAVARS